MTNKILFKIITFEILLFKIKLKKKAQKFSKIKNLGYNFEKLKKCLKIRKFQKITITLFPSHCLRFLSNYGSVLFCPPCGGSGTLCRRGAGIWNFYLPPYTPAAYFPLTGGQKGFPQLLISMRQYVVALSCYTFCIIGWQKLLPRTA